MPRKKYPTVTLPEDVHAILLKYAQSKKLPMSVIASDFIEKGVKFDIYDPAWINKLQKFDDRVNMFASLDDECPALAFTNKDGFVCCRNAPNQKKLGDGESEDMSQVCRACIRVKGILEEIDLLREQVRKGTQLRIPQCNRGGILQPDGDRFWCARGWGKNGYMTTELCERRECVGLKWTHLDIKGELPGDSR